MHSNNENRGRGLDWQKIFKALSELAPAHPFEFGPKTAPLPRVLARAIAGEQNSQSNPDTIQPNSKEDTNNKKKITRSEPDIAQDQDENVTNDKDDPSGQAEKISD